MVEIRTSANSLCNDRSKRHLTPHTHTDTQLQALRTCIYQFSTKAKQTQMSSCVFWSRVVYKVWHFNRENALPLTCIFHVLPHSVCFFSGFFFFPLSLCSTVGSFLLFFQLSHLKASESDRQPDWAFDQSRDALRIEFAKYRCCSCLACFVFVLFCLFKACGRSYHLQSRLVGCFEHLDKYW